ncbi:MAG: hydantoinase/oxoprolinase family protein [Actinobacteria bacterium]|nr:hydantoinase/oxoprolinase family protein [Actinomycetota bacterium]
MSETWVVAIDIGGTFTDAVAFGSGGSLRVAKVPSTPEDPSRGLVDAVVELAAAGVPPEGVTLVSHGTTVATNAVLTGRMARVVLLATEGFRDVLGYRDGTRPDIYSLEPERPSELVPRRDRLEVHERMSSGGVVTPLTDREAARAVRQVASRKPEAVAVALLFSYLDDRHERELGDALRRRLPGVPVTLSSEVAREFREYPRTATAALNAGLRPVVGRYLLEARSRLEGLGVRAPLLVMQSNGGCAPAERAEREAHRMVLSGPAGGVTGLVALGARHGLDKLISLDMGGTSLDVCLVEGGTPPVVPSLRIDGHPILAPSVNIETLGAGGGSIVRVDRSGRLRVGPESAGADPGPAAYARGGKDATVTDAHVVAGTLSGGTHLAGRLALDEDAAREVVGRVADDLGLPVAKATRGILAVTMAHITRALRRVSVERGIDPRGFTMVAFGGAGPLHAGLILRELGLAGVLVPPHPGLFSAAGLVAADLRIDASRTVLALHDPARFQDVLAWYCDTSADLVGQLREDGVARSRVRLVASVDCRYRGQGYELNVLLRNISRAGLRALRGDFDRQHRSVYGHASQEEPVELVALRLSAFGGLPHAEPPAAARGGSAPRADAKVGERRLLLPSEQRAVRAAVYRRDLLRAGNRVQGPAIVEQMDSTTLVLSGQSARVDLHGNLWIREGGR